MPFPPVIANLPGRPAWCDHIGRILDFEGCPCHFGWKFECVKHGSCYLKPNEKHPGHRNCVECSDYEPDPDRQGGF